MAEQATERMVVAATPERCFEVSADITRYPQWAADINEAPKVLSWVQTRGDITSKLDGRYVFAPNGQGGTEVTYHLEVEMKVPLPGFIKMRAQSRIMAIALRELKARVESAA